MKVRLGATMLLLFAGMASAGDTTVVYWRAMDLNNSMVARQRVISTTRPLAADLDEGAKGMAYIEGVADTLKATKMLCIPATVSSGQLASIVAKWLAENPEQWDGTAADAIFVALSKPYGCHAAPAAVH